MLPRLVVAVDIVRAVDTWVRPVRLDSGWVRGVVAIEIVRVVLVLVLGAVRVVLALHACRLLLVVLVVGGRAGPECRSVQSHRSVVRRGDGRVMEERGRVGDGAFLRDVSFGLQASWRIEAHQGTILDTVFASLHSGQSVVRVRVAVSVELRPEEMRTRTC